ncbi:MAG: hypothetical protein ACR2KG_09855 [Nocardioidaceae bacterium]
MTSPRTRRKTTSQPAIPLSSGLGVPVRIRGTLFGSLHLTHKAGSATFTDDETMVQALATAACFVIDNAGLRAHLADRGALVAV